MRRSLAGLDSPVLLPCNLPSATIELVASMASCIDAMPSRFGVYLLTPGDDIAATMSRWLR